MTPTVTSPAEPTAELTCPLCGYSLRGLTEPRCPECGFAFTWAELLDERRDRHRWLFEHAPPGRRARAFAATWWRSAWPRRFWRDVTPANPVRLGRLLAYWLIGWLPLAGLAVAVVVPDAVRMSLDLSTERARFRPAPNRPGLWAYPGSRVQFTTYQLDTYFPRTASVAFVRRAFAFHVWHRDAAFLGGAIVVAVWPVLSAAGLMVFQASLRRAGVRPGHVARAAVYGCDFTLLMTAVVAAVAPVGRWVPSPIGLPSGSRVDDAVAGTVLAAAVACGVVATVRMVPAYRLYMRFDRPFATVLSAQLVAVLAAAVLLVRAAWWLL